MKTKKVIAIAVVGSLLLGGFPIWWWQAGFKMAGAMLLLSLTAVAVIYWFAPICKWVGGVAAGIGKLLSWIKPAKTVEGEGIQLTRFGSLAWCFGSIALVALGVGGVIWMLVGGWTITILSTATTTYQMSWWPFVAIATALYVLGSFRTVGPDENAVKVAFGGFMFEDVGPGLTFVPLWVCQLIRVTSKVITLAGGTPEKVKAAERGDAKAAAAEEKFTQALLVQSDDELSRMRGGTIRVSGEATRITFAERQSALYFELDDKVLFGKSKNPLGSQFTTDPKIVMGILIPQSGIRRLVRRFGSPFGALREIDELMTSHLQILCSRVTAEYFIYRLDDFALMLQLVLEKLLGDEHPISGSTTELQKCLSAIGIRLETIQSLGNTGVDIMSLRIETGLPKGINVGLKTVVETDIARQSAANTGAAQRVVLEEVGAGNASAEKAKLLATAAGREAQLRAEAAGRKAVIEASDSDYGRYLAQLEAMQASLQANSKVIIAPNGSDLLGMLSGAAATLQQLKEAETKKLPEPPTAPPTPPEPTKRGDPRI